MPPIKIIRLGDGGPNLRYLTLTINEAARPETTPDGWWRLRSFLDTAIALLEYPPETPENPKSSE